jgi:hypothetical protein
MWVIRSATVLSFSEFNIVIILNVFCECFLSTYAWQCCFILTWTMFIRVSVMLSGKFMVRDCLQHRTAIWSMG